MNISLNSILIESLVVSAAMAALLVTPLSARASGLSVPLPYDSVATVSQCADSVSSVPSGGYDSHRVRPAAWIVSGAGVALGAVCVRSSWGEKARRSLQGTFSGGGRHKLPVDDYAQYLPAVAGYVLPLCGVRSEHGFRERTILLALSAATMAVAVNAMKPAFREPRPDTGRRNSFPSGHTATAFMGAEYLYREYRRTSPWIGYAGYAVAAGVGLLRVYNDRHWANDVLAGACIGVLSTKFAYWLYPRLFRDGCGARRRTASVVGVPYYGGGSAGLAMTVLF